MKRGAALPAKRIRHRRGVVRSYVLALHPNAGKAEDARYAMWWFHRYWLGFMQRLYGQPPNAFETTAGLGTVANQAQARARATLANLKLPGRLGGWARMHFGTRALQIAEEVGVAVVQVNPAYTSITCLRCGHADKHNRRGTDFCCVQCGARAHADVLAARNLVRKATGAFPNVWAMREGRNTNTNGDQVPLAGGA